MDAMTERKSIPEREKKKHPFTQTFDGGDGKEEVE